MNEDDLSVYDARFLRIAKANGMARHLDEDARAEAHRRALRTGHEVLADALAIFRLSEAIDGETWVDTPFYKRLEDAIAEIESALGIKQ
jgi:hypothetical protein